MLIGVERLKSRTFSFAMVAALLTSVPAGVAQTLPEPMTLQDEGMFFVGGQEKHTSTMVLFPGQPPVPGRIAVSQMFVHYRVPAHRNDGPPYPVVFVEGAGLTGMSYETTPDGREGWATYFTRKGFTTYVVDLPGRGRSGFDPTNADPKKLTEVTMEAAWTLFRFGPRFGEANPGLQFPIDAVSAFGAQNVPLAESSLEGGAYVAGPRALASLLDKIGPAIIVAHSQSGPMADMLVGLRPGLVRGVIDVEGSQAIVPTDDIIKAYSHTPSLELFGDYIDQDEQGFIGRPRLEARKSVVDRINAVGGNAEILQLPSLGLRGNSHMMMQDKNNIAVADVMIKWIRQTVH